MDKKAKNKFLVLLETLLSVSSPPGREERLAALVKGILDKMGYGYETDGAGNVIVNIKGADGKAAPTLLSAHIDEIGFVVTSIDDDGALKISNSGGIRPHKTGEMPVDILGDGDDVIPGILSFGSLHGENVKTDGITWADFKIFTGLSKKELEARGVRPGSMAAPAREGRGPVVFGPKEDPFIAARNLDDRGGVAVLLVLLEKLKAGKTRLRRPLAVAFTVHEEGGCHGGKIVASAMRPSIFVAIEICPMPPGSPLKLDSRPALWSKDRVTHYDHRLIKSFSAAAKAAGTEMQFAVYDRASCDAGSAYSVGATPRAAAVGFACDNSHGYEIARLSSLDNVVDTLLAFIKKEC